ncbi:MAG: protein kinase [Myxococcota bacterium]|nr:protein kinase [Myxococcota bacterium]
MPPSAIECPRDGTLLGQEADPFAHTAVRATPRALLDPPKLGADPLIGQHLGEYRVEAQIGSGGMGLVYRAVQPVIGKKVAIKVLRKEMSRDPVHMERLLAEARAVNAIRHRAIIDIFNFGTLPDGRQYLVMEFLDGTALDLQLQEQGPLPLPQALAFLRDLASALSAAHQAGVVHRDLKPSNVFVVKQGGVQYVKLLDFGLAEQKVAATGGGSNPDGLVMGTPEYMAPEQAQGESVSAQTDLYALGVMAFEMLTGRLPFESTTPMGYLMQHIRAEPPDVRTLRADVPPEVAELIAQLLKKRPWERPASADAVRNQLRQLGGKFWGSPRGTGERPAVRRKSSGEVDRRLTPHGKEAEPRSAAPPSARKKVTAETAPRAKHTPMEPALAPVPAITTSTPPVTRKSPIAALAVVILLGIGAAWFAASWVDQALGPSAPVPTPPPATPLELSPPREASTPPAEPEPETPTPRKPRKAGRGTLTLVTRPEATVKLEGQSLGKTPLFDQSLEAGTHLLELTGPDGIVRVLSTPIKAGESTRLRLQLDQLPAR